MDSVLDQLLDVAETHARNTLVMFGMDELAPLFHLSCPGSHDYIIQVQFSGDASKDEAAQMIREKIRETGATAYMFLSEAWMVVRSKGYDGKVRPADADDRVEVVVAIATDGADHRMRRWRIKRDRRGRCVDLKLDSTGGETRAGGGRFDNLFTRH